MYLFKLLGKYGKVFLCPNIRVNKLIGLISFRRIIFSRRRLLISIKVDHCRLAFFFFFFFFFLVN